MKIKMSRETKWFNPINVNPKNNRASDCVVRAIANASGKTWDEVYLALCELGMKYKRIPNEPKVYGKYLDSIGFLRCSQPKNRYTNTKYTGKQFVEYFCKCGHTYVMNIGSHHVSCVVNNKINDIWDCSNDKVGVYWVK